MIGGLGPWGKWLYDGVDFLAFWAWGWSRVFQGVSCDEEGLLEFCSMRVTPVLYDACNTVYAGFLDNDSWLNV